MKRPSSQSVVERLTSLSEQIRLRILRLLEVEELSVGEVAQVVQLPQSTVSRHLKVLADAAWLVRRAEGTATLYRMMLDDLAPEARLLWTTVRTQMEGMPELTEDSRRLLSVLAERRTDSASFFGRLGGEWESVRTELFGARFTYDALLTLLPRDWTVVDLGCGTANVAELLSPSVRRVIAIDQSETMLAAARKRLAGAANVEFVQANLDSVPLEDSIADAVVLMLVLHHLDDPRPALREAARVTRPGGTVLVVDMAAHDREEYRRTMGHKHLGFSSDDARRLLSGAGLVDSWYRDLPADPAGKGPGLFAAGGARL